MSEAREALTALHELSRSAPDELSSVRARAWDFEEDREKALEQASARQRERAERMLAAARAALAAADAEARRMRNERQVDAQAAELVRRMLAEGVTASGVLERARELNDAETVAALRRELLWQTRSAARDPARRSEFVEAAALLEQTERTLALLSADEDEREANTAAAQLGTLDRAMSSLVQTTADPGATVGPRRLKVAYAAQAAGLDDTAADGGEDES